MADEMSRPRSQCEGTLITDSCHQRKVQAQEVARARGVQVGERLAYREH